jgi:uncharacterized DUF497 family protein
MATRFTWDQSKAKRNDQHHGVSFETAKEVFSDPNQIVTEDYFFEDQREQRMQIIGMTKRLVLLLVVFVERTNADQEVIHIVSARKAQAFEESAYQDQFV